MAEARPDAIIFDTQHGLWDKHNLYNAFAAIRGKSEPVVRIANDSEYGLSAAVFTRDIAKGIDIVKRLNTGIAHINGPTVHDEAQMPFGGTKASGTGREGGSWSYEVFLEPKNVAVSLGGHPIPHWGA